MTFFILRTRKPGPIDATGFTATMRKRPQDEERPRLSKTKTVGVVVDFEA
jgi:hypothetical protein